MGDEKLTYREMQAKAKELDLPATGTAEELEARLAEAEEGSRSDGNQTVETAGPVSLNRKLKVGATVQCKGVAYFHNAPFDARGEKGKVTRVEGDMVYFDNPSRGSVSAHVDGLKVIK